MARKDQPRHPASRRLFGSSSLQESDGADYVSGNSFQLAHKTPFFNGASRAPSMAFGQLGYVTGASALMLLG